MQATLIYNANAGSTSSTPVEDLLTALQGVGYEPVCPNTTTEDELDDVLRDVRGLVIAAGGDGTIRAVAKRLLGKPVGFSILPMGTMNNIALTLELTGTPLEIIAGLRNPRKRPLDIGKAMGSWGEEYFLEGAGFGFFADLLANAQPNEKSLIGGMTSLAKTLVNFPNYACRIRMDGEDDNLDRVNNFVMVEILNTKSIGPRLRFAPNADPGDGYLDLVRIYAGEETSFLQYITTLLSEGLHELPNVEVTRVRKVEMELVNCSFHVDDQLPFGPKPPQTETPSSLKAETVAPAPTSLISVEVLAHALELWLPEPNVLPPTA